MVSAYASSWYHTLFLQSEEVGVGTRHITHLMASTLASTSSSFSLASLRSSSLRLSVFSWLSSGRVRPSISWNRTPSTNRFSAGPRTPEVCVFYAWWYIVRVHGVCVGCVIGINVCKMWQWCGVVCVCVCVVGGWYSNAHFGMSVKAEVQYNTYSITVQETLLWIIVIRDV